MTRSDRGTRVRVLSRAVGVGVATLVLVSCTSGGAAPQPTVPPAEFEAEISAAVEVAESLCPVIRDWAEDIAGIMNGLSTFGIAEPDPEVRNAHYLERIVAINERNAEYDRAVAALPSSPLMDELVGQIRGGLVRAVGQLEDMSYSVNNRPDLDGMRPQVRISGLFVAAEKVVSFGKPRLGSIKTPAMIAAFQQVDECARTVMDITGRTDDIEARAEPSEGS